MISDWLVVWIGVIIVGIVAVRGLVALRRGSPSGPPKARPPASTDSAAGEPRAVSAPSLQLPVPAQLAGSAEPGTPPFSPLVLSKQLEEFYDSSAHPEDLLGNSDFEAGVARLRRPCRALDQVVNYCMGANAQLAALGAEALARRADSAPAVARAFGHLRYANVWTVFFILRFLDARTDRPAHRPGDRAGAGMVGTQSALAADRRRLRRRAGSPRASTRSCARRWRQLPNWTPTLSAPCSTL